MNNNFETTIPKKKVFISSVQKELEVERVAIAGAVSGDQGLSHFCEIVLYEKEPLSGKRISRPYLECLNSCDIYILVMDREYGYIVETISATHEEYRNAMTREMPMMIFVRGHHDADRQTETQTFFDEIRKDGHTYRRFHDRVDLLPEIKQGLCRILDESFGLTSEHLGNERYGEVGKASHFEQEVLEVPETKLDLDIALEWLRSVKEIRCQLRFLP